MGANLRQGGREGSQDLHPAELTWRASGKQLASVPSCHLAVLSYHPHHALLHHQNGHPRSCPRGVLPRSSRPTTNPLPHPALAPLQSVSPALAAPTPLSCLGAPKCPPPPPKPLHYLSSAAATAAASTSPAPSPPGAAAACCEVHCCMGIPSQAWGRAMGSRGPGITRVAL